MTFRSDHYTEYNTLQLSQYIKKVTYDGLMAFKIEFPVNPINLSLY